MAPPKSQLGIIFFTTFLDLLGVGIIIPIIAPLFLDVERHLLPDHYSFQQRTMLMGVLISSFSLMQFFGSSFLGALSDKLGRKKVLFGSIIGTTVGYLIIGSGIELGATWMLFAGRMLNGFCAGNLAVIYSSLADISKPEDKSKNFGMVGAAFGIGFVIGPFLGGQLANNELVSWFTYATPFWFSAGLAVVNLALIYFRFKETIGAKVNRSLNFTTGFRNIRTAFTNESLRSIFAVSFLFIFGFTFFTQFIQVYLIENFDYREADIGQLFGYMGIWIALTQGVFIRPVSKRFTAPQVLRFSLPLLAVAMLLLLVPNVSWQLFLVLPFISIFQGLSSPNITATVSNLAGPSIQGEILGINQSVNAVAQMLPPLIGGVIVGLDIRMPIYGAALFIAASWLVLTWVLSKRANRSSHAPAPSIPG
jgi:DHA1 family tetracycline resistance protein-like MFS transporter